jgi:4-carboxymuconolactone decarboxylase
MNNGVKPSELSEIITHLAFYSGWANAMSAVAVAKDIFHQRRIGIDQLPPAKSKLLPLNEEAERQRATQVSANFGATFPRLVQNTTDLLFRSDRSRLAACPEALDRPHPRHYKTATTGGEHRVDSRRTDSERSSGTG